MSAMIHPLQRKDLSLPFERVLILTFLFLATRPAFAQQVDLAIDLDLAEPGIQATAEVEFGRRHRGAVILTGFAQELVAYTVIVSASPPNSILCAETEALEWACDAIHGTDASSASADRIGRMYDPPVPPCLVEPPADPLELYVFEICPVGFPLELRFATDWSLLSFSEGTLGDVPLSDARAEIHSATLTGVLPTRTPTPSPTRLPTPPPQPTRTPTPAPTVPPPPLLGDLNGDRQVDALDLYLFADQWQKRRSGE